MLNLYLTTFLRWSWGNEDCNSLKGRMTLCFKGQGSERLIGFGEGVKKITGSEGMTTKLRMSGI